MPPSTSSPDVSTRDASDIDHLLAAALRLVGTLPAARPTVGIVRGWSRGDRERARLLREGLDERRVRSTELSPVAEAGERDGPGRGDRPPRADLLVYAGGSQVEQAMRAAALWGLPLLVDRPQGPPRGEPNAFEGRRRPVVGFRLSDGGFGVAVRETVLVSLQPHPGHARLILDNEKITAPGDRPLRITLTDQGLLEARGDSFGLRRIRRLRFERAWGAYRLEVDGVPSRDVRAPLRIEALPGRLHLLHP
ncbi:hypothetical protein [Streptomyces sp. DH24]|uniref:hypothetical protein n=1 Tax=Streptomyces sp. DH24 TaxID=3040123 RepID=UPI002442D4EE|nr:hypothetical protein [Streptomyces sp. DH24]MDG9720037.1 hypothetical protein [Streptomyces sp. DH24]